MNPMVETLQCPSCGAPLDYDPRAEAETFRCPFCESTVMLPKRERPFVQPPIVIERKPSGDNTARTAGVIVAFVSVIVTAAVIAYAFHSYYSTSTSARPSTGFTNTKNSLASKGAGDGYAQPE